MLKSFLITRKKWQKRKETAHPYSMKPHFCSRIYSSIHVRVCNEPEPFADGTNAPLLICEAQ